MATATTNILINSIRGRIGNVVFYTRRRAASGAFTQCVRKHVIPHNPDTEAQRIVRRAFSDAVRSWQAMTADEQYAYTRKARNLNMSGYNLYISNYLKRLTRAVDRTSIDKLTPLTWNLELSTWNLLPLPERFPSVSASYLKASVLNTDKFQPKLRPG